MNCEINERIAGMRACRGSYFLCGQINMDGQSPIHCITEHFDWRCRIVRQVYGEKRKCISFNLDDAVERELFDLAREMTFSRFVKRCLEAELERRKAISRASSSIQVELGEQS